MLSALILTACPEPVTYALRDTGPAGGLIFFIDEADEFSWDYLEAAPVSTEIINKEWGSFGSEIGGTGTAVGDGKPNTAIIVTALDAIPVSDKFAQLCRDLTVGDYSDWFLPSKDELDLMYQNLYLENVGSYTDTGAFYLSSSEIDSMVVWRRDFSDVAGDPGGYKDTYSYMVRAARAF